MWKTHGLRRTFFSTGGFSDIYVTLWEKRLQFALEHDPFIVDLPIKVVVSNSYVKVYQRVVYPGVSF